MTASLDVFRYNDGSDVRTATLNGEPALVLSDLAKVLGYRMASDAGRMLRDHHKGYAEVRTPGGTQTMIVVTEAGANRLVMRSNAAHAERVQDWLSDEVMPSIRRTGGYVAPQTREQRLAAAVLEANAVIAEAHEQIADLTTRAEAWDELVSADGDFSVADAAKILARAGIATGPQRLFDYLTDHRWTFRGPEGRPRAYADRVDSGHLAERPQSHHHPRTGAVVIDPPQIRITVAGLNLLRKRMQTNLRAVSA